MKKILFATSALIATAGMAAAEAEVTFGGYGRFGLVYDEGNSDSATAKETRLETRFRLNIGASTTTDSGVKFEGRFQLETNDNSTGGQEGEGPGAAGFAVSAGGFRLDVGNVSDVFDSGDVIDIFGHGIGLTDLVETNNAFGSNGIDEQGFGEDSIDQNIVKVRYSVADFTVAASYTEENDSTGDSSYYQIGAAYSFGDHTIGAAYGDRDNAAEESYWAVNANGEFGALGYNLLVGDSDAVDDVVYGLSLSYDISSATELRFASSFGGDDANDDAYGIGFRHKLGGGVSLRGGAGQDIEGNTIADLGVRFDF
ncbi:porin [Epibacterium sp. SM1979]|uniref:Porin n=1 Tax=Tritonibacter litoralis TaxID=2662264 RepID=A0A843YAZ5_9RHOB|nr:porin [Tritonibacter litoralis]MQQ08136.1 porin [Tritonibacter litoralis]